MRIGPGCQLEGDPIRGRAGVGPLDFLQGMLKCFAVKAGAFSKRTVRSGCYRDRGNKRT